jgi:hypothetical protein
MPPQIDLTKLPLLEVARLYIAAGYSVIPLIYRPRDESASKRPAIRALAEVGSTRIKRNGKTIGTWIPYQTRMPTDEELVAWFGGKTRRNIGVVTGAISGNLVFCDIDSKVIYAEWAKAYPQIAEPAPTQETRKGFHVGVRMMVTPPGNQICIIVAIISANHEAKGATLLSAPVPTAPVFGISGSAAFWMPRHRLSPRWRRLV